MNTNDVAQLARISLVLVTWLGGLEAGQCFFHPREHNKDERFADTGGTYLPADDPRNPTDANQTDPPYYGYRYYNASTGKWISRDPLGVHGGLNTYGTHNSFVNQIDALGLTAQGCKCCECAVDIEIRNGGYFPPRPGVQGWDFGVYIYLEYHPHPKGGLATYKYEEKTHEPVKEIIAAGGKPDQWYDYFQLRPDAVPDPWKKRITTCNPPVGRIARDADWVQRPEGLGRWVIQFRLTVVNPKDCGCGKSQVVATAALTLDPNSPTHGSLQIPDPNQ